MPTELIQALIAGDVIATNGVRFKITKVTRFSINVEIDSPSDVELVDDAPSVSETATDPNAAGMAIGGRA